ncbi:MAG: hypothetical protein ABJO02_20040 [Reichenbachiella sp.]|uniref:hypothetical protein n=1 Tax=Reichenbachiella sp. TaxID=2184521 RepID=UPI003297D612
MRILNTQRVSFIKRLIKLSSKGILYSLLAIGLLLLTDYLILSINEVLQQQNATSIGCALAESNFMFTIIHGVKQLDYLIEVINVSAGILGVLLGLFYTAFLTIIATKYSNINSTIGSLLLEQKPLNQFFILLASLTSFSILLELLLSAGYYPTLASSVIFLFVIISTLIGFISFGKFALVYFDTSVLVYDLIDKNNIILFKIRKYAKRISASGEGNQHINRLYINLKQIGVIVSESRKPEVGNTSFDTILSRVLDYALHYTQAKHYIPASDEWHIKINKPKRWEEAQEWDYNLLRTTGVDLQPVQIQSYNLLESTISNIQIEILDHHLQEKEQLGLLFGQDRYVHNLAYQFDFETFSEYFMSLEKLIADKLITNQDIGFRVQVTQSYAYLLTQYLVGYNTHLSHLSNTQLEKTSIAIAKSKPFQKPYFLCVWEEGFNLKLASEKEIEGTIVTPLVFLKYELAEMIQFHVQDHYKKITGFIIDKVPKIINKLKKESFKVEALQLSLSCMEVRHKMGYFLRTTQKTIESYSSFELNLSDNAFMLTKFEEFDRQYQKFEDFLLSEIWDLGVMAYEIEEKNLPDLYGNFYQLILDDITKKILTRSTPNTELLELLTKFNVASILYLESLRNRYKDAENVLHFASRIYPFIIDLLEVNSLMLIRSISLEQTELRNKIFEFWDDEVQKSGNKVGFWNFNIAIYQYYQQPGTAWSMASASKEQNRQNMLEEFFKSESIISRKTRTRSRFGFVEEYYETEIDDVYLKTIVSEMDAERMMSLFNLHEFFVEYYLRLSIDLKDIDIKETRYGERVRRNMGRKAE